MSLYPASFERLVEQLSRLPGVGSKSAQRMAFWFLRLSDQEAEAFVSAITEAKRRVHRCETCQNLTDDAVCPICASPKRDRRMICVVSEPRDVIALERSREYNGLYHVLHGVISPLRHMGPEDITAKELISRLDGSVEEVIMATNPDTEGEATAMYLSRLLKPFDVKITRLAYGTPVGGHLEYTDSATLTRALEGRMEM